jgi:hypothetical protein
MMRELTTWEWSRKSGQESKRKENIVRDISLQLHSHPQIEMYPSHQRKEAQIGR